MTQGHDTQDKKNIQPQMRKTICSRDSLLKRSLSSHKSKGRYAYDADQW